MEIQSKTFCHCIGFISDKYRVLGNTTLLISSPNYAKYHVMYAQEAICVPRFIVIFQRHPV